MPARSTIVRTYLRGRHATPPLPETTFAARISTTVPVQEPIMTLGTILLILLILILIGALPTWNYSRNWGYGPSGIGGVLVLILIILLLTGRL